MSEPARASAGDGGASGAGTPLTLDKAYKHVGAWLLLLVPAALGVGADLWLKHWSFPEGVPANSELMRFAGRHPGYVPGLGSQEPWVVIPKVLGFTTTVNQGAVFGFGQGNVGWFLAFSMVALAVIIWVFATSGAKQRVVHLALGLILAGALGNMYDRAVYHGVRDMLKFFVNWYPYIFNIADVCLCVGVPLLIVRWVFVKDEPGAAA